MSKMSKAAAERFRIYEQAVANTREQVRLEEAEKFLKKLNLTIEVNSRVVTRTFSDEKSVIIEVRLLSNNSLISTSSAQLDI